MVINGEVSSRKSATSGVSWGSVQESILLIINIHDSDVELHNIISNSKDDTKKGIETETKDERQQLVRAV